MSKIGVSLKIDLDKIDQSRVFVGSKGRYLDATVFVDLDELDQYDNSGMIVQNIKKEEKEQGIKAPILGNCKFFWGDGINPPTTSAPNQQGYGAAPQQVSSWVDAWEGLKPAGKAAHLTIEQIKNEPSVNGNVQAAINFGWVSR